jgi:hypothetical protein
MAAARPGGGHIVVCSGLAVPRRLVRPAWDHVSTRRRGSVAGSRVARAPVSALLAILAGNPVIGAIRWQPWAAWLPVLAGQKFRESADFRVIGGEDLATGNLVFRPVARAPARSRVRHKERRQKEPGFLRLTGPSVALSSLAVRSVSPSDQGFCGFPRDDRFRSNTRDYDDPSPAPDPMPRRRIFTE